MHVCMYSMIILSFFFPLPLSLSRAECCVVHLYIYMYVSPSQMRPPGARSVKRFSFLTVFGVVSRLIAAPFGLRRRHIARMKALIHPSRGGGEQQGRQQSQNWRRN